MMNILNNISAKNDLKKYLVGRVENLHIMFEENVVQQGNKKHLLTSLSNLKEELYAITINNRTQERCFDVNTADKVRLVEILNDDKLTADELKKSLDELKVTVFYKVCKSNINRIEELEKLLNDMAINQNAKIIFMAKLKRIKNDLEYMAGTNAIEKVLIEEIEELREELEVKIIDTNSQDNDEVLREISILNSCSEDNISILVDKLKAHNAIELNKFINQNSSTRVVALIQFIKLTLNLDFNYKENLSDNKTRFKESVEIIKRNFDSMQKYSSEALSFDIPRRKSDLLYGFRELMQRYSFATDKEIRMLLNIIGIRKLPQEPNDYKQLAKEWRVNVAKSLEALSVKNNKDINITSRTANQYKPTKK